MADKSVCEKLLIKSGYKILLVNAPKGYKETLGEMPEKVDLLMCNEPGANFIQLFIYNRRELIDQVVKLKQHLKSETVFWISYLKGTAKIQTDINRDSLNEYLKSIGMQIVSMVSVDSDWSAARVKPIS